MPQVLESFSTRIPNESGIASLNGIVVVLVLAWCFSSQNEGMRVMRWSSRAKARECDASALAPRQARTAGYRTASERLRRLGRH